MSKKETVENVKQYSELIRDILQVRSVILQQSYRGEEDRPDGEIEVAVIVDHLGEEEDYIELKHKLTELARQLDPRIEVELIESDKDDPTGFFDQIRKTGEVIYPSS